MTLTQRVTDHLIATGTMTEQHVTRRPRLRHCGHCGLVVLAAISDAGFTIAVWPWPTTAYGELDALMRALPTYTHHSDDGLYRRDDFRIRGNNTDRVQVHVTHRCGDPPPPLNPAHAVVARERLPADALPPF